MLSFHVIKNLPILLPTNLKPSDEECVEEWLGEAKIIITHVWMPVFGAVFHASLSGNARECDLLVDSLTAEFGLPLHADRSRTIWHFQWASPSTEAPPTRVQAVLGEEKLTNIFKKHELTPGEIDTIRSLLANLRTTMGSGGSARLAVTLDTLSMYAPARRRYLLEVLGEVNLSFLEAALG